MNLTIEEDEEPFPYPREPIDFYEMYPAPPARTRAYEFLEILIIYALMAALVSSVCWQVYGAWLLVRAMGRFLWRAV